MSAPRSLDEREAAAVRHFAHLHGRTWKAALRATWMRACSDQPMDAGTAGESIRDYRCTLQQLRNDPDWSTCGLAAYRLPEVVGERPRPPLGFREGHSGDLACTHRDISCCAACAGTHPEIVEVYGQHFWVGDPRERAALALEMKRG